MTCDLLGVPGADRPAIARLSRSAVPLGDPEFGDREASFRAVDELKAYAKHLRDDRLTAQTDDLLTVLATRKSTGNVLTRTSLRRSSSSL